MNLFIFNLNITHRSRLCHIYMNCHIHVSVLGHSCLYVNLFTYYMIQYSLFIIIIVYIAKLQILNYILLV